MRYYFLFYLLIPSFVQAQYEYLKLENTQIYFEKIYTHDSLTALEIEKLLLIGIPKLKDVTDFNKSQEIIIAKLNNTLVDFKKYGGKWGNTAAVLNHPLFADVLIIWKDGKYKVTVSNMYFNTDGLGVIKCSDFFTKKHGSELSSNSNVVDAGIYLEKYLADLFLIKQDKKDW